MNKHLKNAILKAIENSTLKHTYIEDTDTYVVSTPKFVMKIRRTGNNANLYGFCVTLNDTYLLSTCIERKYYSVLSTVQRDALEIWQATENKYIQQQQMNAKEQAALKLMESYISKQKQDKTR